MGSPLLLTVWVHCNLCSLLPRLGAMSPNVTVPKRSLVIGGRRSSVSIEDGFWDAFKEIADARKMTVSNLATYINARRNQKNLSSAIRLFVLGYYVDQIKDKTGARKEHRHRKETV
jgi:predicted DNA-binding ribbon-helix-helix protein